MPRAGEKAQDLCPRDGKQRPHHTVGAFLAGAGQARQTAAPLARQHVGLDRVVALVRRRDAGRSGLLRHLVERFVPDVARTGFRREAQRPRGLPRVAAPAEEGQREPTRVVRDEGKVPVGIPAAPPMMHMSDGEAPSRLGDDLERAVEQRHRIRAARDGEEQRGSAGRQTIAASAPERGEDRVHPLMVRRLAPGAGRSTYAGLIAAMRFFISSGDTSSMCVPTYQLCPNGSTTPPMRSP